MAVSSLNASSIVTRPTTLPNDPKNKETCVSIPPSLSSTNADMEMLTNKFLVKMPKYRIFLATEQVKKIFEFITTNNLDIRRYPSNNQHARSIDVFEKNSQKHYFIEFNHTSQPPDGFKDPCVGRGSYKKAKLCFDVTEEKFYVRTTEPISETCNVKKEIGILEKLQGKPGIIQLLFQREFQSKKSNQPKQSLFFEFFNWGNLQYHIKRGDLLPTQKDLITHDLLEGLVSIHEARIIHRDIKPENILCKTDSEDTSTFQKIGAVITDFGFSVFEGESIEGGGFSGSPAYQSPEIIKLTLQAIETQTLPNKDQSGQVTIFGKDIWSMGLILGQLYQKELSPDLSNWITNHFSNKATKKALYQQTDRSLQMLFALPIPSDASELEKFIRSMLSEDPKERPDAQVLLVEFDRIAKMRSPTPNDCSIL